MLLRINDFHIIIKKIYIKFMIRINSPKKPYTVLYKAEIYFSRIIFKKAMPSADRKQLVSQILFFLQNTRYEFLKLVSNHTSLSFYRD